MEFVARIFDIQKASLVDGPGIRTTFFFKGCNLRCRWCHNPEGLSPERELMVYKSKCTGCGKCSEFCMHEECIACGACEKICPRGARKLVGKDYTVEQLVEIAKQDIPFYRNGGGITVSGGECLLQHTVVASFLSACKQEGMHTAVDTAGCVPWKYFEEVLPYTDMVLYDIKCISSELHKEFTGVDNNIILENLVRLFELKKRIWIRIPFILEFNGNESEMKKIHDFLSKYNPEKIEILPYHSMGISKYQALNRNYEEFVSPDEEQITEIEKYFKRRI